jgi:hypothetical protein
MDSNPQINTFPKREEAGLGLGVSDDSIDDGLAETPALGWLQSQRFPHTTVLKAAGLQPVS